MGNNSSIVDRYVKMTADECAELKTACEQMAEALGATIDYELGGKAYLQQKIDATRYLWRRLCPTAYDKTEEARIPVQILNRIMTIDCKSGRGVYVSGNPGTWKTRSMWCKLAYEFVVNGAKILHLSPDDLAFRSSWVAGNPDEGIRWMSAAKKDYDIVFLDDLFKNRITDTQEFVLFGVIEGRMANGKATLITSNVNLKDIPKVFTDKGVDVRSQATMRRIAESCEVIELCK